MPTSFFGTDIPGARYLARVTQKHATMRTMVWLTFEADDKQVYVPHGTAAKWLITDEEAEDETTEWYTVEEEDGDEDGQCR